MPTIAVIGAGAVGCYYGAMLARAGNDVRFLMRRDLEAVRRDGLEIRSWQGDFRLEPVAAFATSAAIGPVDWVLLALKTTQLEAAPELLAPCLGPETRVVALMNGLGIEDRLAAFVRPERVFGAMAFVCINRGEPGIVHHLKYGRLTVGHACDDPAETTRLAALLEGAGLDVAVAPNLRHARWDKLCWNVPFNGLSAAGGGLGTEAILADPPLRRLAETAMREVARAANADLEAHGSAARLDPEEVTARMFALTETMGDYRTSMATDYLQGNPLEVETILGAPARRAAALGVPVPTIDALYALVHAADLRRRGLIPTIAP